MIRKNILLLLLVSGFIYGCENPEPEPEPVQVPAKTLKINTFIKDVMEDVYLWEKNMPDLDVRFEFNSRKYFEKLLYKDDKWSELTSDIQALLDSFEGVETSFGYSLAFGRFSNTNNIFAVVQFVYPNTPAAQAGLKRGDIIVKMDGMDLTDTNYRDLLYAPIISISMGILGENGISVNPNPVSMVAKELNLNPVLISNVVEHAGHKIGYLFYAQYISNYNSSLDTAFQYFSDEGITDLVIDLRYNPGGYTTAAQHLCSSVAPLDPVFAKKTLVTLQWNDYYQDYWSETNQSQLKISFINSNKVKLGLNKLYILTGPGSASASELTITGLRPYMDVITVGETTHGKYTASITLLPEDYYEESYYKEIDNWGLQPIICRYANSLGVTDFKDGFAPNIYVEDDLFAGIPLGDKQDPLFKKAIEDITGEQVVAIKRAGKVMPYTIFDRGFSRFEAYKQDLILDHFNPGLLFE